MALKCTGKHNLSNASYGCNGVTNEWPVSRKDVEYPRHNV